MKLVCAEVDPKAQEKEIQKMKIRAIRSMLRNYAIGTLAALTDHRIWLATSIAKGSFVLEDIAPPQRRNDLTGILTRLMVGERG